MTLIDGDKIVTAQLYDDEHEEFTEKKMSIIEYVNSYTDEGVTVADDVLDKIRTEIKGMYRVILKGTPKDDWAVRWNDCLDEVLQIIDKYKVESDG